MSESWFDNTSDLSVHEIVKLESSYRIDSLVCAIEECIIAKEEQDIDINDAELVVLAVEAMEREINSGGFSQFFSNSSWRFTPYLVDCLELIGSTQAKKIAEQAITALDVSELEDINDYQKFYDAIQDAVEQEVISEKLEAVDGMYYKMDENIAELTFAFIKKHIDSFDS